MTTYTLPPYKLPQADDQSANDATPPGLLAPGVELIIGGLDRANPGSALDDARRIVNEYNAAHPEQPLPPLKLRPASTNQTPLDYVYAHLDPQLDKIPRPDILQDTMLRLVEAYRDQGQWLLKTELDKQIAKKGHVVQGSWIGNQREPRITYNLVSSRSAHEVLASRPVVNGSILLPSQPRFIQPQSGLEVAIAGCTDFIGAQQLLDNYIRATYGNDAIATSRMELYDDVYCAVLKDWDTSSRLLSEPFEAFLAYKSRSSFTSPTDPMFLYEYNSMGAPANPSFLLRDRQQTPSFGDPQTSALQDQINELRKQGTATVNGFQQMIGQHGKSISALEASQDKIFQGIAALSSIMSSGSLLAAQNSTLQNLTSQRSTLNILLTMNSNPQATPLLNSQAEELDRQIKDQQAAVDQAKSQVAALNRHFSPTLSITEHARNPQPQASTSRSRPEATNQPPTNRPRRAADEEEDVRAMVMVRLCPPLPDPSHPVHTSSGLKTCSRDSKGGWRRGRQRSLHTPIHAFIIMFVSLVVLPLLASHTFRTFSINTNGFGDVMKQSAVNDAILSLRPNAFVINETKSSSPVASRIHVKGYKIYESEGVRSEGNSRAGKWGVIVGIEDSLHAQRVEVSPSLKGRAVALDVIVPTSSGKGFCHRFIGIYAPWKPGEADDEEAAHFWTLIALLCQQAPYSWSIEGDCNATTSSAETTAENYCLTPARRQYVQFLNVTNGKDLWMDQPDRNAAQTFTYKGPFGQSIIDRVAHSTRGILGGTISVPKLFIPATDHRLIVASIALCPPPSFGSQATIPGFSTPYYDPRSLYPKRGEKHRFKTFSDTVDELMDREHLQLDSVTDETSWTELYGRLTKILQEAAHSSFEYPTVGTKQGKGKITSTTLKVIVTEIRRVNRLISSLSSRHFYSPRCMHEHWARPYFTAYQSAPPTDPSGCLVNLETYLKLIRRALSKLRYREEKTEIIRRQDVTTRNRISSSLHGGSTKKLYGSAIYDPLPLALSAGDDPISFVTSPEGIKTGTMSYFVDLFHRHPRAPGDKPWLTTPSVLSIKQKADADPFTWPNPLSVTTLRGVLRKGTPRPCPGPDGWEKWWLKAVSDRALKFVVELLNFEIVKSCFPSAVKPTTMATIHKRGARTQLANTRGVCFSNQLVNIPFAWLNSLLIPYITRLGILPEGQIATQPGVQGRDLVSFLAQVEVWSNREKQPIYICAKPRPKEGI
ncbi:hypothetical protein R3P38DRAFT_3297233 [Favolaschia claudopus]|uniref:Reverse transcriptase n=1 Tax=Favolaschia claudopus TaxID=2862362 RepID=A0AAV9Z6M5_9AGAR